ncbi:hypothetical protein L6164_000318 [Bauhinia variegata]|uniref:Uncharacterized protein n=1 Tax=Bauhinia variegata TaxID=167791 RepID=A0ACB9Q689_BAUVA|nr:hypothetical protein L6164_000318 [Bauhinia variegata]
MIWIQVDDSISIGEDGNSDIIESSSGKALITGEGASSMEPYVSQVMHGTSSSTTQQLVGLHKVMMATVRCEEICNQKYESFEVNELVEPEYQTVLKHLRLRHLNKFMESLDRDLDEEKRFSRAAVDLALSCLLEFDMDCTDVRIERANWDTLKEKARLQHDMNSHIVANRDDRLTSKIRIFFEPKLKGELSHSVGFFLCEETDPNWSKIRERFKSVMKSTLDSLVDTMIEFGVDEESRKEKVESIKNYAKEIVEAKAREESGRVKDHLLKTFVRLFMHDDDSWPNSDWNNIQEIEAAYMNLFYAPLNVLAGLAAIRLADDETHDNIHYILSSALIGSADQGTFNNQNSPPDSGEQSTLLKDLDKTSWAENIDNACSVQTVVARVRDEGKRRCRAGCEDIGGTISLNF